MREQDGRTKRAVDEPDNLVDEASVESFPASDPPAWEPTHAGPPTPPEAQDPPTAEPLREDVDSDSSRR